MSKTRESFYLQSKELRASTNVDGSRSISGLVAYNSPSSGLPWTETVAPGAFADALKPSADVLLLRDHRQEYLLARTLSKTLTLEDSPNGLKFTAKLSNSNSVAADTLDSISRGDLTGVSFGFVVSKDAWADDGAGKVTRTLLAVTLYEISVTSFAAFPDSTVSLRSVPKELRALLNVNKRSNSNDCDCPCPECEDDDCERCSDLECDDPECEGCPNQDGEDRSYRLSWSERTLLRIEVDKRR